MPESVITTSTRGRASQRERHQRRAGEAAVAVEARLRAHQCQRLGDRPAFALQVVGAPEHHRDRFRKGVAVVPVPSKQALGLARAVLHRVGARDAERIEAVDVAAGRQDRRRAQQVAARRGAQEAAVEGMQHAGDLVVFGQQPVGGGKLGEKARQGRVGRAAVLGQGGVGRAAGDQRFDHGALRSQAVARLGERQQQVDALGGRRRLADDVQAVRDQRVLELKHGLAEAARCARVRRRATPARSSRGRARRPAPGSGPRARPPRRPARARGRDSGRAAP